MNMFESWIKNLVEGLLANVESWINARLDEKNVMINGLFGKVKCILDTLFRQGQEDDHIGKNKH